VDLYLNKKNLPLYYIIFILFCRIKQKIADKYTDADVIFIKSIKINLLTRNQLAKLINIYELITVIDISIFCKGFITKMNISS
jgi:hypothetical protein